MSKPSLVLATPENGLMERVITAWDAQIKSVRVPHPMVAALRNYEASLVPDKKYGVYVLCHPDESGNGRAPFEAVVHINHMFPKHQNPTLRLLWLRIAPKYEWSVNIAEDHGRIFAAVLGEALRLSSQNLKSSEVKVYLANHMDRTYGRLVAVNLTSLPDVPFDSRVRGNWLHLEWK